MGRLFAGGFGVNFSLVPRHSLNFGLCATDFASKTRNPKPDNARRNLTALSRRAHAVDLERHEGSRGHPPGASADKKLVAFRRKMFAGR